MDTNALSLLVEIVDTGNLSQAARKLKMTRANVSYHLTQLEKSVGVQLVKRTTRRVEPTEIGMRLYEHGRNIHNEMLAAREAITALGQSLQQALQLERDREAAIITFLVTASGLTWFGIGAAFWGLGAGALALLFKHTGKHWHKAAPKDT